MRRRIGILLILIIMVVTACSQPNEPKEGQPEPPPNQAENLDLETIDLTFSPVPIEGLVEGQPQEEWVKGKSIYFGKLPNQVEATVHLYLENISDALEQSAGAIYGFLEHGNKLYELGNVGNYGLTGVSVDLADWNFNGIKDIEINGMLGMTYVGLNVLHYNENSQEWVSILEMANPQPADLDGDGQDEIVSVSYGSMTSRLELYRWNQDHFEKVNIAEVLGSTYAQLHNTEGKWLIESAKYENGKAEDIRFYRYEAGKLIEQDIKN